MLYYLGQFDEHFSVLNIFRYITFRTAGATVTAIVFVFLFGPMIIAALRLRQGKGQPIRADGPQSHLLTKKGTPTMGGLMILSGLVVTTLLWANLANPYVWVVLFVTIGFGAVGLYDDYLKVTKATAGGYSGRARLAIEAAIAIAAAIAFAYIGTQPLATELTFPFFKDAVINLGWFFVPVAAFVIVGAGNAVNLTDGLDGLAIVPVMIAAASFALIAYLAGNAVFADYLQIHPVPGTGELAVLCGALLGAGLGFLWFNAPPSGDLHGRHRVAGAGRPARRRRRRHQAGDRARHRRRAVRAGGRVGHRAGRVVQADRQARLPHGADPSSFRGARLDGIADRDPLLDHRCRTGAGRPVESQAPMIPVFSFRNQNVAVFGLGESGKATALALIAGGALVAAFDDSAVSVDAASSAGVPVEDLRIADWQSFAALVLAPGVPLTHPKPAWPVVSARAAGIEIIGDIELFCRERTRNVPGAPFIAITGTNGKSTTTALIAHILSATGPRGRTRRQHWPRDPVAGAARAPGATTSSSVRRSRSIWRPASTRRSACCSTSRRSPRPPRHARGLRPHQGAAGGAVGSRGNRGRRRVDAGDRGPAAARRQARHTRFHAPAARRRRLCRRCDIYVASNGNAVKFMSLDGISTLRGQHNAQNAAAAIAVCRASGLNDAEIATQVRNFAGLPHRLEEVGRRGRVTFMNDSKATNADATAKALAVVSRIYWIAGGRAKAGGHRQPQAVFPAHREGIPDR